MVITAYVIVNDKGEYFSNRSGKCTPELKLGHLYNDREKALKQIAFHDDVKLQLKTVELNVTSVK